MIAATCTSCAQKMNVKDTFSGKTIVCPACAKPVRIPICDLQNYELETEPSTTHTNSSLEFEDIFSNDEKDYAFEEGSSAPQEKPGTSAQAKSFDPFASTARHKKKVQRQQTLKTILQWITNPIKKILAWGLLCVALYAGYLLVPREWYWDETAGYPTLVQDEQGRKKASNYVDCTVPWTSLLDKDQAFLTSSSPNYVRTSNGLYCGAAESALAVNVAPTGGYELLVRMTSASEDCRICVDFPVLQRQARLELTAQGEAPSLTGQPKNHMKLQGLFPQHEEWELLVRCLPDREQYVAEVMINGVRALQGRKEINRLQRVAEGHAPFEVHVVAGSVVLQAVAIRPLAEAVLKRKTGELLEQDDMVPIPW